MVKNPQSARIFRKRLLLKISFMVVLTTTIVLSLSGLYRYTVTKKQMTQSLKEVLELTTNQLAISLKKALFDFDDEIVKNVITAEMGSYLIEGVFIMEQENILYGFVRDGEKSIISAEELLPEEDYFVTSQQIQESNTVLGELKVFVTDHYLKKELTESLIQIFIQILILDVLIIVVLTLLIKGMLLAPLNQTISFVKKVSIGDLTTDLKITRQDEVGELLYAINQMLVRLRDILSNVKYGANNVADSSQQMSSNSEQMSQGATQQATAAEEASTSMEQMAANIRQNADNALQTEKIALNVAKNAQEGGKAVVETVNAMQEIAKKIAIIEEIATQTRMLSLNATIEAARAQEHGRGFAVVASEVRALAERSQTAASEINSLATNGVAIAEKAGQILNMLVPDIQKTAELVQEISAASSEQNTGTEQINKAIQQLDQVIQQNASMSEEMSSTAEELANQAEQLQNTIAFFQLADRREKKPHSKNKSEILEMQEKEENVEFQKTTGEKDQLDEEFTKY